MVTAGKLAFLIAFAQAACTSGAPPGFSGGIGDRWSFPLVGPLENNVLITQVSINTDGPYLFMIDPDATISIIDAETVKKLELRTFNGPHRLDETDTQQARIYTEVFGLEIGSLVIERTNMMIVRTGAFDFAGRRIVGVLGRDLLADSLVFGFDRDQGLGHLIVQNAFKAPPDATALSYVSMRSRVTNAESVPDNRRLVDATVNGAKLELHVDFGAVASQLRAAEWPRAKLVARDVRTAVIDEVGTPRRVTKASEPVQVAVGKLSADRIAFIPYADQRWDEQDLDGTLGLDFFAAYSPWLSWHEKKLYVAKRREVTPAMRIARWDSAVFAKCKHTGCASLRLVDPLAGKPAPEGRPHPGVVLSITRDEPAGGMPLEVVVEAQGRPALPRLLLNMPPHVDRLISQLAPEFLGATLVVVDASPYPRTCPGPNGCVDLLAR